MNVIVYRTALIADPHARAKVDVELAEAATGWGALSEAKVEQAIDYWVDRYDPYALRRWNTGRAVATWTGHGPTGMDARR